MNTNTVLDHGEEKTKGGVSAGLMRTAPPRYEHAHGFNVFLPFPNGRIQLKNLVVFTTKTGGAGGRGAITTFFVIL